MLKPLKSFFTSVKTWSHSSNHSATVSWVEKRACLVSHTDTCMVALKSAACQKMTLFCYIFVGFGLSLNHWAACRPAPSPRDMCAAHVLMVGRGGPCGKKWCSVTGPDQYCSSVRTDCLEIRDCSWIQTPALCYAPAPDVLCCNDTLNGNILHWDKVAERCFLKGVSSSEGSAPIGRILNNSYSSIYQVLNRNQWGSLCCHEIRSLLFGLPCAQLACQPRSCQGSESCWGNRLGSSGCGSVCVCVCVSVCGLSTLTIISIL